MVGLQGQVALITGGGRGLGAATTLALAQAGADVALVGRTAAALDEVAAQVTVLGRRAQVVAADVAEWEAMREVVAQSETALGPITILINNAAVGEPVGQVATLDPAAWAYNLMVNLDGPFYAMRAVLPGMLARGWGRIINVSSGAAVGASPGLAAYSAAKAGLLHLTRVLAAEVQGSGVVPLSFAPGIMDTQMQTDMRANPLPEAETFRQYHAQGWLRPPAEAAACIAWLCGPDGAAFAGEFVNVHSSALRARVGLPELPEALRRP